jgi:transposase
LSPEPNGADEQERPVPRRELKRTQMETFFAKQEPTEVVLEACGGSHHWGRLLSKLGHRVRLIPPQYVKTTFVRVQQTEETLARLWISAYKKR